MINLSSCSQTIDSQPTGPSQLPQSQPLYHYVIVRDDLPHGLCAAQIVHAAGESSPGNLPAGTYAVVLAASKERLADLEMKLQLDGIRHRAIRESDPPYCGELLAIGISPVFKKEVKKYISDIPLLK